MLRAYIYIFGLASLFARTAAAQEVSPELCLGVVGGGGWYGMSAHSYTTGLTESALYGMGPSFGATARFGLSTAAPGLALMLAVQGDLLSLSELERFSVSDATGLFGLRYPLGRYHSMLVAGLLGVAFSTATVNPGLTYGGMLGYRFEHLFVEERYQAFVFDMPPTAPSQNTGVLIHQLLLSVGVTL